MEELMSERSIDELGPVDYLIVEFPAGAQNFSGEALSELIKLHDAGVIRVMDLVLISKTGEDSFEAMELGDLDDLGDLARIEAQLAETLSADDVANLAAAMAPGSVGALLIYENLWAAAFGSALRRAGGQLVADGRIPIQALIAAVQADEAALETEGA
jgi:hypothetical protein